MSMAMNIRIGLVALVLACAIPAHAQDRETIPLPPAGSTLLQLQVSERTELVQDVVSATLSFEVEGTSAADVQNRINSAMSKALAAAKSVPTVEVETGSYMVYMQEQDQPVNPATGRPFEKKITWRGQQYLTLKGTAPTPLLDLAGALQGSGFMMSGLQYSLSPAKAEAARTTLITAAMAKLQAQAKEAAKGLGKQNVELVEVVLDGGMPAFVPYQSMMRGVASAESASMAAPVASPGKTEIVLNVSGKALLQ